MYYSQLYPSARADQRNLLGEKNISLGDILSPSGFGVRQLAPFTAFY